jgi:Zn finger protein HypA/HybF involved in hydrogenase expression
MITEIKNECQDCHEESWDNYVWDKCPACKSNNTVYKVYKHEENED